MADDKGLSGQQIKELQDRIAKDLTVKQQCINNAVKASEGKDWTAKAVADLAADFHAFMVGNG